MKTLKQKMRGLSIVRRKRIEARVACLLKEGAVVNAERDLAIAREWFPLDEEASQLRRPGQRRKR